MGTEIYSTFAVRRASLYLGLRLMLNKVNFTGIHSRSIGHVRVIERPLKNLCYCEPLGTLTCHHSAQQNLALYHQFEGECLKDS